MSKVSERKWLPIMAAAIIGITIDFFVIKYAPLVAFFWLLAASYVITGFIAGYWTRRTRSGVFAATVVAVALIIFIISIGISVGGNLLNIQAIFLYVMIAIFGIVLGALGGSIGKHVRKHTFV
jgi:hypothetical protein